MGLSRPTAAVEGDLNAGVLYIAAHVRLGEVPLWRMRKNVVTPSIVQGLRMLRTVDTIIVSDVHLGSTISRAGDLQRTLAAYRCNRLILLGDLFHDLTDTARLRAYPNRPDRLYVM